MNARWSPAVAVLALALALGGCALDPSRLPLGTTKAEALQRLGPPTSTYPMPAGGERLQYSRGPSGFTVSNLDVDATGKVVSVRQELDDTMFDSTVKVDQWHVPDVLRSYGRPYQVSRVLAFNGEVWAWHYRSNNMPRLFYIYVDPDGLVVRYHTADDLSIDARDRR